MAHLVDPAALEREEFDRARLMRPAERLREGLCLFDRALMLMRDGLRHRFPDLTEDELSARLSGQLDMLARLDRGDRG